MSAHTADSNYAYQLPSLSYIDAKWEEPNLRAPAQAIRPTLSAGIAAWLATRMAAATAWYRTDQAVTELTAMSDRDLMDIGISRADIPRVFDAATNKDLRQRGA
jgi:hypothetical protein